jgi:hypothetical protein
MTGKAKVTVCGTYRSSKDKKVVSFSDVSLYIPDHKAHVAKSEVRSVMKKHLNKFFPDAKSLRKIDIVSVESETLDSSGKPVDVMSLEELAFVIRDKDMNVKIEEFPSLSELRHAVKLYLTNEDDALAYIKSKRQAFKEEREIMDLNPQLVENSTTYLDPSAIKEAKKVKVQKPQKDFHKATVADLDTDAADTNIDGTPIEDDVENENPEELRQRLLTEAKSLGLKPNVKTGILKLQAMIESHKANDDI